MNQRERLEQAIAALEAQRSTLGDEVVNEALVPLRDKLTALLAEEAPAERQRKQITVLFADVSGFTALSDTLDPEEVSELINDLWKRLDTVITSHGGIIDKHIGDAVMGLFGAVAAHEDDPERAIHAALAMQQELQSFVGESTTPVSGRKAAPQLQMRIGINTGLVLLGTVGTTSEFTAIGDAVNVASRLEHAAPVGGVMISHDTYRHVRGVFEVEALDPIKVKGKPDPIRAYLAKKTRPRAFRVPTRGVVGLETRMVGRETELRKLQACLERLTDPRYGEAQVALVVADAGVGKSRLLYEFTNWLVLQPDPVEIFKGRTDESMVNLPYSLIRDMLASRFDIRDGDSAATARDKLAAGISEMLGKRAEEQVPFIGHLIGFDYAGNPYLEGVLKDAQQVRDRAFFYLGQYLATVTRHAPLLIFLEDIHWADQGTLDFVEYLSENFTHLPLMVVGLTRDTLFEGRPRWGEERANWTRIDLQPLAREQSEQLVVEILRYADNVPSTLRDLIVTRAEGNPFYLEEVIKMLIDDGVIVPGAEQWQVSTERLPAVKVPPTLTGVLQVRLEGLPVPERKTLQRASVVGREFWDRIVERLRDEGEIAREADLPVAESLTKLQKRELVFEQASVAFANAREYIFKHAILRDVTYESVLMQLRRVYHGQVASWLVEQSGERVSEYAGRIGEHYQQAGAVGLAAEWFARAGRQAKDTYAPELAVDYYQRALALWSEGVEHDIDQVRREIDVYAGLGEVMTWLGRFDEAITSYQQMRDVVRTVGDREAQARSWDGEAAARMYQGDLRGGLECAEQAEAIAREAGADNMIASALGRKGWSLFRLGEVETALKLAEEALAMSEKADNRVQMASSLNLRGAVSYALGRFEQAASSLEDALDIFRELDDRRWVAVLSNNLAVLAEARGDYSRSLSSYQEALQMARDIGNREGEMTYLSNLGGARVKLEDYPTAEAELRQVIEMAGAGGTAVLPETHRFLAEAYLGQGKVTEALVAAQQSLALAQAVEAQDYIAAAWRALGLIAAQTPGGIPVREGKKKARGRTHDARSCFERSIQVATEIGNEGERAHTLRVWARYEIEEGNKQRGITYWNEAHEIFGKLDAHLEVERMAELPRRSRRKRQTS